MDRWLATMIVLLLALPVRAEAPRVGRPTNYSHVEGRFTLTATVEPMETTVEEPITLRVKIEGAVDEGPMPERSKLQLFPATLDEAFFVEPLPQFDTVEPGAWTFVWRLRPKSTDVDEVPSLSLVYFSPKLERFQTARSEPISLHVRPHALAPHAPAVAVDPAFLMVASPSAATSRALGWPWIIVAALAGAGAGGAWRRYSAPRSTPRGEAARSALANLERRPCDAPEIVTDYIRHRLARPLAVVAPVEMGSLLKRRGVSTETRRRWVQWWQAHDAAAYAPFPPPANSTQRAADARELILRLEAEPWFGR